MDAPNEPPRPPELALIDPSAMRGLEIGPLANPRVRKAEGPVFYLDHATTAELRAKYEQNETLRPQIDALVEVDFVQHEGDRLVDVVGSQAPFDYLIASHVIEHIPDLVGWLEEIAAVLRPGGIFSLVVPDKRFCFDINRTPTETSLLVDAYLRGLRHPSYQQIFDNFSRTVTVDGMVDTVGLWEGTVDYDGVLRSDVANPSLAAFQVCLEHRDHPDHPIDIHCHVFTPASFLRLVAELTDLGLIDYEVAAFTPTPRNALEFYVSLRKIDRSGTADEVRERLRRALRAVENGTVTPAASDRDSITLSPLERRLIATKRGVMTSLRTALRRGPAAPTER